ncbi:MAG TPA: hypothetical protein DEF61_03395 [Firmicutes bacterium]|nr:hypothetical protein [Bacillota bacterium]HBM70537.1 hypothetical protein [Bacillota bacterium]HBX25299.1 hypothetical protein [Bacillota bacterium]
MLRVLAKLIMVFAFFPILKTISIKLIYSSKEYMSISMVFNKIFTKIFLLNYPSLCKCKNCYYIAYGKMHS